MAYKKLLILILDLLAITFVILNVLAFELPIGGIPLRFLVMGLMICVSFVVGNKYFQSKRFQGFIIISFGSYLILSCYSALRSNEIENIIMYDRPILMLLTIPAFMCLFECKGIERYLKTLSIACVAMVIMYIVVTYRIIQDPGYGEVLNKQQELIHAVINPIGVRVTFKTFVFLIPFSFYIMYKAKGFLYYLFSGLVLTISVASQTYGIVFPIFAFYFFLLYKRKKKIALVCSALMVFIILSVGAIYVGDLLELKESSASEKSEQMQNLFKGMDGLSLLFGRGIGCVFDGFDIRELKDEPMIEVAFVQIFQWGGLLFTWLVLFVYIKPCIDAIRENDFYSKLLGYSQAGLLLASMSNPYLWGGTGLLLIVFIVAYRPQHQKLRGV